MKMKKYVIEFKETYMDKSVVRECIVSDFETAIKFYGLNESDIEYWKVLEESEVEQ